MPRLCLQSPRLHWQLHLRLAAWRAMQMLQEAIRRLETGGCPGQGGRKMWGWMEIGGAKSKSWRQRGPLPDWQESVGSDIVARD